MVSSVYIFNIISVLWCIQLSVKPSRHALFILKNETFLIWSEHKHNRLLFENQQIFRWPFKDSLESVTKPKRLFVWITQKTIFFRSIPDSILRVWRLLTEYVRNSEDLNDFYTISLFLFLSYVGCRYSGLKALFLILVKNKPDGEKLSSSPPQ